MSIETIERAAAIAWPAVETTNLDAWTLSAGDGFSRRRNSAIPVGPAPTDLENRIRDVSEWYRSRELPTLYRITPACDPAVDAVLAARGFSLEAPTLVMTRPIESSGPTAGVVGRPTATQEWIAAELEALGVHEAMVGPWLTTIRSVPSPAAFVSPTDGDRRVGAGLGVVVDDLVGVFEVVVHPAERSRGHATRMMAALHEFGARNGASRSFLQVLEGDDRAIGLHRSLGYHVSHRYWYRRNVGESRVPLTARLVE